MTLDNLVGRSLERAEVDSTAIKRLLDAAARNIKDAKAKNISNETRFDAAYKAIMQMANAALQSNGYRTLTSKPGHHQTMIQSLPQTIGIDNDDMVVLDALRKQRNVADYSGDLVPDQTVKECIVQADKLWKVLNEWLKKSHSEITK